MHDYRQAHDDLLECSAHIECAVHRLDHKEVNRIDSINCIDITLQAAVGIIRANTDNMREYFEAISGFLIEVDLHRRSSDSAG